MSNTLSSDSGESHICQEPHDVSALFSKTGQLFTDFTDVVCSGFHGNLGKHF